MGYLRLRTTEQLRRGGADRADTAPRLSPLFSCPGEENEWWCVQDLQGEGGRSLAASDSDGGEALFKSRRGLPGAWARRGQTGCTNHVGDGESGPVHQTSHDI